MGSEYSQTSSFASRVGSSPLPPQFTPDIQERTRAFVSQIFSPDDEIPDSFERRSDAGSTRRMTGLGDTSQASGKKSLWGSVKNSFSRIGDAFRTRDKYGWLTSAAGGEKRLAPGFVEKIVDGKTVGTEAPKNWKMLIRNPKTSIAGLLLLAGGGFAVFNKDKKSKKSAASA